MKWTELNIQPAVSEKTVRAYKLITGLYELENGGAGGAGHIVFDDQNVEVASIDYCLGCCDDPAYVLSLGAEVVEMSRATLLYFKILSIEERYTALAFHWKELNIFNYVECL